MFKFRAHLVSLMVCYAIALHLSWAIIILVDPAHAIGATAVASLYEIFDSQRHLVVFLLVTACVAIYAEIGSNSRWASALLLPQQFVLFWSASAAIKAIWIGEYADGTVRPSAFIAADQIHVVWAAIGHMCAVIAYAARTGR